MKLHEFKPAAGSKKTRTVVMWFRVPSGRTSGRNVLSKPCSGGGVRSGLKAAKCLFIVVYQTWFQITFLLNNMPKLTNTELF